MITGFKIRAIYLLLYMAFAVWRVFYNIYLETEGLKGSEIGTINAIMQSTIFIVVAVWGMMADKRGIRPTLRIAALSTGIFMFFLGHLTEFWLLLIYIPIVTIFFHPLGPLTDALAIQYSELEKKGSYGTLRLWGSLGWAIASVAGGMLFANISLEYMFPLSAFLFICMFPFLTTKRKKRTYTPNFKKFSIQDLIKDRPLSFFVLIAVFYGLTCSPINSYLNLYFTELNANNNIVGTAYAIMAFSELPLFVLGNKLLIKWGSRKVMLIAMFTILLRYCFYGLCPNIELALFICLLQGVSFAFFLVAAVDYIKKLMPAGRHATAQSILWGAFIGVGQTVGNLIIGFMIDWSGMVGVMKLFIIISAGCAGLTILYFNIYQKPVRK